MRNLLFAILLLLYACGKKEILPVRDVYIEAEVLTHIEPLYNSPYVMLYNQSDGSLLLNMTQGEYCMIGIDPSSGQIDSLIRVGRGRDEYIQLRITDIDKNGNFYGTSHPQSLGFSQTGELLTKYDYSETNNQMFWTNRFKDKYVVYGNYKYPNSTLTLFDNSWQELNHFGEFPDDGISETDGGKFGKIMAYQGIVLSSDSLSRVGFVSRSGEFFSIYHIDDNYDAELIYTIQENLPQYKKQRGNHVGVEFSSIDFYYIDAYSTDDKIYILYSGRKITTPSNAAYLKARLSNRIMVFDWGGNHLYNINSNLNMLNLCVSGDNEELYAVFFDDDAEFRLCRFDISEVELD